MKDCHCHLDTFVKNSELEQVLERAEVAGVSQFICAGTSPNDWNIYRELAQKFSGKIFYTLGLHPCDADAAWEDQLAELEKCLDAQPAPVAVGEIGIDEHWMPKDFHEAEILRGRQLAVFSAQLDIARRRGLPVVVHARDAFTQCVDAIDKSGIDWRKVVFHCFAEGAEEVTLLNERGGRASFTGTITYKNAEKVRSAALTQGLDKLMLETDCPYLPPQKLRGRRNEPAFLRHTAEFTSELFGVPIEVIDEQTSKNVCQFFGI